MRGEAEPERVGPTGVTRASGQVKTEGYRSP